MAGKATRRGYPDGISHSMNRSLMPLAGLYRAATLLRQQAYRRGWFKSHRLSRPVISIGNLTVGGSGKTPLVAAIAEMLLRHGYKPAILTRGYARERGPDLIVVEPHSGEAPHSRRIGDEPALLARALPQVPIVICADRYRAGRLAEERFGADVHILDDGFQHLAIERDVDVVTIDVTQELAHGALLPAGRLREPPSALTRADIIVLTRTEVQDPAPVELQVSLINPSASVFHCVTELQTLYEWDNRGSIPPADYRCKRACAFCAIGNPSAFFSDLRGWGFRLVSEIKFRDHHAYRSEDIRQLNSVAHSSGAEVLLTTEKDFMNLPPQPGFCFPVLACKVQAKISTPEIFEQALVASVALKQLPSGVAP